MSHVGSVASDLADKLILDGSKVGWYGDRIAAWRRGERIAPVTVDCAMTRACNVACSFCYASLQASEGGKITRENFFAFLEDCAEIGVKGVSFISDGESTVVPWYPDAVEHAASLGLAVGAGSNGIKLTKPVLERVLPHLSYLRFNFSAGERKRYAEIMGCPQHFYDDVIQNIRDGMEIINRGEPCHTCEQHNLGRSNNLNAPCPECGGVVGKGRKRLKCSLNMQMVCDPKDADQIIPFARLVAELKPVYGIIKHCASDIDNTLGVDYSKYDDALKDRLREAEAIGRAAGVRITAKWSKIEAKCQRNYTRCYGPPFQLQASGNGNVAPCGFLFNSRYAAFHMGNFTRTRFKDIWASDRYKEVLDYLGSEHFNPQERCGPGCLQNPTNEFLFSLVNGRVELPTVAAPPDLQFI